MHETCIFFIGKQIHPREVTGARILEVGSQDVNGSIRRIWETWEPSEYVGVDIISGRGVDIVLNSIDLASFFGQDSFDIVVSTEMLEHAEHWRAAITNMKQVVKPGGIIVITTRSRGMPYHSWPYDFWRYDLEDMSAIFDDFEILALEADTTDPGVFVKARKPLTDWKSRDLLGIELYSIVRGERCSRISAKDYKTPRYFLLRMRIKIKSVLKPRLKRLLKAITLT